MDRRQPIERIRAALSDGGYEEGKRYSRPGRVRGMAGFGQLVPLMAADVVALCASVREPDDVCRTIARGCGAVPGDTVVRLEADDVFHLLGKAGKAVAVSVGTLPGGTILVPEAVMQEEANKDV